MRSGPCGAAAVLCLVASTSLLLGQRRPRLRAGAAAGPWLSAAVLLLTYVEVRSREVARACAHEGGRLVTTGTLDRCDAP